MDCQAGTECYLVAFALDITTHLEPNLAVPSQSLVAGQSHLGAKIHNGAVDKAQSAFHDHVNTSIQSRDLNGGRRGHSTDGGAEGHAVECAAVDHEHRSARRDERTV